MAFPNGYQSDEAQDAITLCAISYQGENDGNYAEIQSSLTSWLTQFFQDRFTLVWLGISPDWANLLYVVKDTTAENRYALVARGTDWNFLTDWVDDFDVLTTHDWPTGPPDSGILVAQGSWDGLQALLTMTSPPGGQTLVQFLGGVAATGLDLFITGHSLGGALATILGLYLVDTVGQWAPGVSSIGMKTYTFAAPTSGNPAYASYYDGRAGESAVAWQAYRVFNEHDLVPFAYADLGGYVDAGLPFSLILTLEVAAMAATAQAVLTKYGVTYAQAGDAVPLDPATIDGQSTCAHPADSLDDFACWVTFEHASTNYMKILGLDPDGLVDRSIDLSAISSANLPGLEGRAAALRGAGIGDS